jgi:hypothetical protein
MRNDARTTSRVSFALTTVEGDAYSWDFGVQIYHATSGDTLYTIQRRINNLSSGVADMSLPITNAGAVKTTVNFLIRVTDSGSESGANYHSRVQVSIDGGSMWIYDTKADSALPNGFRFDGAGRYIDFDVAGSRWAIDGTILQQDDKRYFIWSGWADGRDRHWLCIAPMRGPLTISGNRVRLCVNDDYLWERVGEAASGRGLNEAPPGIAAQ